MYSIAFIHETSPELCRKKYCESNSNRLSKCIREAIYRYCAKKTFQQLVYIVFHFS